MHVPILALPEGPLFHFDLASIRCSSAHHGDQHEAKTDRTLKCFVGHRFAFFSFFYLSVFFVLELLMG